MKKILANKNIFNQIMHDIALMPLSHIEDILSGRYNLNNYIKFIYEMYPELKNYMIEDIKDTYVYLIKQNISRLNKLYSNHT